MKVITCTISLVWFLKVIYFNKIYSTIAIMTDQELKLKYIQICKSLSARRLKPAFDLLGNLIPENGLGIYYDEYRNLEDTYQNMLKYTMEGIFDPERQKIYRKLIVSTFTLADKVNEAIRLKFSPSLEYVEKRMFRNAFITDHAAFRSELEGLYVQSDPKDTERFEKRENEKWQKIELFFHHIWFTDKLTAEEAKHWNALLVSPWLPVPYKSLMITAVMLSLRRFFDTQKFMMLFDHCDTEEPETVQRAMIGLLINLYSYDARLMFYPDISGRLKILGEKAGFRRRLQTIIFQFIRSKGTEKLQQRIREEILPEMIKISPNLKDKINLDSLMEEGLSEDRNPDWEDIFKDSPGFLQKMEEFSEMQMKGDDVFMGSFSMLKSFPFFNNLINWFIPFFPENPEIAGSMDMSEQGMGQLLAAIEHAPILCNSDKYSFCLSIRSMPKENVSFMTQAMQAEMDQIKELTEDEVLLDPGRREELISNQYIQDMYRFFKLFPRRNEFEDIFSWRLDFHNTQVLGEVFREDPKMLRNIAEYYFVKEYYTEAAEIFEVLLNDEKNVEVYQKIAWCHQKTGDIESALEAYLKAELHGAGNLWNLKKIALCYHNLKKPDKALEYYYAAEKMDPDNLGIQINIGHCLLELDRYEEALKCYFKVEYLAPGNKKVWRPIGWCSFLTGKKEQADKYFNMLMDNEAGKHDFISMGHVKWSLGNRKSALEYYRKSISKKGFTEKEFLEIFEEDKAHLLEQGIDKDDIPIMLDQLRYLLGESEE